MYVIVFTIAGLIYYSWFGGADFAARAPVTGLGADGSMSQYSFAGGLLFGVSVYDWRAEAGNTLINAGFNNFSNLYNQSVSDPVAWDINQLTSEQKALQPTHQKYLGDNDWFVGFSNHITNTDNKLRVGNIPFTSEKQGVAGGINILDYKSRIEFGCKLLGYSADQGCKP
jgi:hypothetical protein